MEFCSNCGKGLREGAKFCGTCGHRAPIASSSRFCVNCGHELNSQAAFCPQCGRKIGETIPPHTSISASVPLVQRSKNERAPVARLGSPKNRGRNIAIAIVLAVIIVSVVAAFVSLPVPPHPQSQNTLETVLSSRGRLGSKQYTFAPVLDDEPGVDGYSTDAPSYDSQVSLILSTFSPQDLVYLVVSIASQSLLVPTVRDSYGMSWTNRASISSSGLELETWYAINNQILNRDNISVTLTNGANIRISAVAIRGVESNPFPNPAINATGFGDAASVPINSAPQGPFVYIGALASTNNYGVKAGSGFTLRGENTEPPTVALETAPNFHITREEFFPFNPVIEYTNPNATYTLAGVENWAMIGDAVAVIPSLHQKSSSTTMTTSETQGPPVVATCISSPEGGVTTMIMNGSELAGWINGYVTPIDISTQQCSTFSVPTADDYYLVIYNNQSTTLNYSVESYLTYSSDANNLEQQMISSLVTETSQSTGTVSSLPTSLASGTQTSSTNTQKSQAPNLWLVEFDASTTIQVNGTDTTNNNNLCGGTDCGFVVTLGGNITGSGTVSEGADGTLSGSYTVTDSLSDEILLEGISCTGTMYLPIQIDGTINGNINPAGQGQLSQSMDITISGSLLWDCSNLRPSTQAILVHYSSTIQVPSQTFNMTSSGASIQDIIVSIPPPIQSQFSVPGEMSISITFTPD